MAVDEPPIPEPDAALADESDAAAADADRPRRRMRWWEKVVIAVAPILAIAILAATFIGLPYVVFSPGNADPVQDAVTIEGAPSYPLDGSVLFLTVKVTTQRPNLWRVLQGWIDDNRRVMSEDEYFGDVSRKETRQIDDLLMVRSQDVAKLVALERLGYEVPVVAAEIGFVVADGPSAGTLEVGDVIDTINGQSVTTPAAVGEAVRANPPGSEIAVGVTRGGETMEQVVTSGDDGEGHALLGISSVPVYAFPIDITIDTGAVSGPSAGLAFTITILDELTSGELTGGKTVAMTGTINERGEVGLVGGVRQKAVAARRAGAALILVPLGEESEAREGAGDVPVVGVATLDDALDALYAIGGDVIPEKLAA